MTEENRDKNRPPKLSDFEKSPCPKNKRRLLTDVELRRLCRIDCLFNNIAEEDLKNLKYTLTHRRDFVKGVLARLAQQISDGPSLPTGTVRKKK